MIRIKRDSGYAYWIRAYKVVHDGEIIGDVPKAMKILLVALTLAMFPATVFATAQIPDSITYKGESYALFSEPLESGFTKFNPRPDKLFEFKCTACWRGYIADWEIKDNYLFLNRVVEGTCGTDAKEIAVSIIFPGKVAPVRALWYSGDLRIPQGKQLYYEHMGYESVYERDVILTIVDGELIAEKVIDNTKSRRRW